ncbi:MAG: hypothetical protein NCW75_04885 [Phycisphaera sp.]|nr:MAG: hypothetical protein NCW75_04885 [Phycisphaera sp.]
MLTNSLPLARIRAGSVTALLAAVGSVGGSLGASAVGLGGLPALGVLALGTTAHCAMVQCGPLDVTQSIDPDTIQPARAVWCGSLETNAETQIGREFTAPYDMTISCVTFGVTSNTGAAWPCHVRILGGPITAPHATRPVLSETTVMVPAGTTGEFFTATLPAAFLPAGAPFIVELDTPSRRPSDGGDGALLSLGFNGLGQSSPTYLRAPACGAHEFIDTAVVGFPNSHAAISVGVIDAFELPTLGGFPITPIGPVVVGTAGGEVAAFGDGGLSIALGDLTMGADLSFRVMSTGDETDPIVDIGFHGATTSDRLVFHANPADPDQAVLDVLSDNPAFDRFRVRVFRDGVEVGTLEDQASGSVRFADAGEGPIWDFIKGLFGGGFKAECKIHKEYFESGALKSSTQTYGASFGTAVVVPPDGGVRLIGDEVWIEPMMPTLAGEPPLDLSVTISGLVGVAVDVDSSAPGVVIGEAESKPRPVDGGVATQVGVSIRTKNADESSPELIAAQMIGDGAPDLRVLPSLDPEADNGFHMELGGVVSATVGLDVQAPDPSAACMTVCSFEVGPVSIPTGKTIFDPWPIEPSLTAIAPDFSSVGDETYTLQIFDDSGTMVHTESGLQGIAGGTSQWPSKVGKLGGPTPCFTICYPTDTLMRLPDGREFLVHEVRALAEGAPPAGPLASLDFTVQNMSELVLFDPETVLPEINEPCYADLDGDGALTLFDFLAFQNLFATGDPVADCDSDGALTLFDFLCFQNEFAVGCP